MHLLSNSYVKKTSIFHIKFGILFFAGLLLLLNAIHCRNNTTTPVTKSFYYWKTRFDVTAYEQERLSSIGVNTLYIKYFDIDWNDELLKPFPKSKIIFLNDSLLQSGKYKIIPTIFITNNCMHQLKQTEVALLAKNIIHLIQEINTNHALKNVVEWQIDCDWTANTSSKYFELLQIIHQQTQLLNIPLSATIRLYQCKYLNKTGVPPVDKGLLMCYNMGNLKSVQSQNSIIEYEELIKYTSNLQQYPLQLDIAFPLFDWFVLFKNQQFAGLLNDLHKEEVDTSPLLEQTKNSYTFKTDGSINGFSFYKGDILRYEKSDMETIEKCAATISVKLSKPPSAVAFYHLDSITLYKYNNDALEKIWNYFH